MKKIKVLLFLLILPVFVHAEGGDDILGNWFNEDKSIKIQFAKYENLYYANIIWMSEPKDKEGNAKLDKNNPDPQKRNNPIVGLTIVWGLKFSDNGWSDGYVYSPQKGMIVNCDIHVDKGGHMVLVASKFGIKKEKIWIRE